jgi:hypothetical protein
MNLTANRAAKQKGGSLELPPFRHSLQLKGELGRYLELARSVEGT